MPLPKSHLKSTFAMRILDWYILRRFGLTLLYAILSFILIVIFVDLVGNLGKFIDKDVPKFVIVKYYVFYIPYIVMLALPIAMLLSSLFTLGLLSKYNELTAIKSVGISLYRILLPVWLFSTLISLSALTLGELIVPGANQEKTRIDKQFLERSRSLTPNRVSNIFWRDKMNRRLFIGHYENRQKVAHKVTIQKYQGSQIVERIDAPKMQWRDSTWVLMNGYKRTFTNNQELAVPFDSYVDHNIDVRPEKLLQVRIEPEDMSFAELQTFSKEVKRNGGDPNKWLVDLHFKISIPFANFIMVLFGAPLASNKNRSGAIFGFMVSLLICFIYYGSNKFVQTLGHNGILSPLMSAWTTNAVFFAAGLLLTIKTRK